MESNGRKRRGFIKGKLMPFAAKTKQTTGLVGYVFRQDYSVSPPPLPPHRVSLLVKDATRDSLSRFDDSCGVDEGVDVKAAKYISYTQERFRLERVNSERKTVDSAGDAIAC